MTLTVLKVVEKHFLLIPLIMSPLLLKLFSYAKDLQCSYKDFSQTLEDSGNLLHLIYLLRYLLTLLLLNLTVFFL